MTTRKRMLDSIKHTHERMKITQLEEINSKLGAILLILTKERMEGFDE